MNSLERDQSSSASLEESENFDAKSDTDLVPDISTVSDGNLTFVAFRQIVTPTITNRYVPSTVEMVVNLLASVVLLLDVFMWAIFVSSWILFDRSVNNNFSLASVLFSVVLFCQLVTIFTEIVKLFRDTAVKFSFSHILLALTFLVIAQEVVLISQFAARNYCGFTRPVLRNPVVQTKNWFSLLALCSLAVKFVTSLRGLVLKRNREKLKIFAFSLYFCITFFLCFGARIWYLHLTYRINIHCYNNDKILKVYPENKEQLMLLHQFASDETYYQATFWTRPQAIGETGVVQVSEKTFLQWTEQFHKIGLKWVVLHGDVQKLIDEEHKNIDSRKKFKHGHRSGEYQFDQYHNLQEIMAFLQTVSQEYPDIVELLEIGRSYENRPLVAVKISNCQSNIGCSKNRAKLWLDFGIHSREWITQATAVFTIYQLVLKFARKARTHHKQIEWYILPVANPDGYEFTWTKDRLWRKSREPTTNKDCIGTDLNRNFNFKWAEGPGYKDPCNSMYAGSKPFSSPETSAIAKFLTQKGLMFQGYINVHAFSQLWLYPYSHAHNVYPEDKEDMEYWAQKAVGALKAVNGTTYRVGSAPDFLYQCYGVAHDWAKHDAKIKFSYAIELRPRPLSDYHFKLPPDEILPTAKELFEAFSVMGQAVIEAKLSSELNLVDEPPR